VQVDPAERVGLESGDQLPQTRGDRLSDSGSNSLSDAAANTLQPGEDGRQFQTEGPPDDESYE
jgi:hypothetical protein